MIMKKVFLSISLLLITAIIFAQKINDANAGALHVLIDTSRSVYQALEGQGLSEKEKYEIFFFNMIFYKLNSDIQLEVEQFLKTDKYPVMTEVLDFLE